MEKPSILFRKNGRNPYLFIAFIKSASDQIVNCIPAIYLIDGWDFEDDNSGNWTIETEDNFYNFTLLNGTWQMIDRNGDTVDTFPPFSTLKDEPEESTGGYQINDNGEDSPRVIGEVAGGTETASEGDSSAEGNDTPDSPSGGSEGNPAQSETNPLPIVAGVAALAGVGGAAYYFTRKRK